MRPTTKIVIALGSIALLGFVAWEFFPSFRAALTSPTVRQAVVEDVSQGMNDAIDRVGEVAKRVSVPGPLVSTQQAPETLLTRAGVIRWTNIQRNDNGGLAALTEESKLNAIAEIRLNDMFEKGYFAHDYPGGITSSAGAKIVGYDYIAIGENIALGDFGDDEKLVQAWMDSPGHRANILATNYTQIGVAVGKGVYDGRTTWIGVQIFGRPAADCPQPNAALRDRIDALKAEIDDLNRQAAALEVQLKENKPRGRQGADDYNRLVDQYNGVITVLNGVVAEVKELIEQYNASVQAYNACVNE